MDDKRLSFKEMAARFDVTPRTLRYYEYIELLSPLRDGRARWYGPREIARMTLILRGRRYGFSLEEIRQWLLIYEREGNEAQRRRLLDLADRQLSVLEQQQQELAVTLDELRLLRDETRRQLDEDRPETAPGG
ncbi:MerR family transcriptional regulator [Pseudoroseicyclus aestuarii]|uniref:MerR family transcriptional regulator n=1 Tax=Pseudoroseicyclus aestuarii TaxID=1795041 RepID=A0A318SUA8_9RHOB|nr:MerR family DNA-binding transcriptional regulator [Pseudoroseicyclus aestuarii]PYE85480.1 MerR family transcriptional regulator [Pseudoroseicyclus aestuarii]